MGWQNETGSLEPYTQSVIGGSPHSGPVIKAFDILPGCKPEQAAD